MGDVIADIPPFVTAPVYRRRHLRWGATTDEASTLMPGDDLVARPQFCATRAITIDAPPQALWPWLVQVGFGRAGFYSNDLLGNLARPSATTILAQHQHLQVGRWVSMSPTPSERTAFKVHGFQAPQWLLWAKPDSTWSWTLTPTTQPHRLRRPTPGSTTTTKGPPAMSPPTGATASRQYTAGGQPPPAPSQPPARALIALELFLAAGAALGAIGLITGGIDLGDATDDLPFASPVFAGVALAVLNGLLPTVVAVAALRRRRWSGAGHLAVGVTLVAWIMVQVAFIGLGSWLQIAYALYGVVIAALAVAALRHQPPPSALNPSPALRR